jgi:hypothetical protein
MFSNTKINFEVGVEIDEDEIEGVEKIIKFLQELIDKAREKETKRPSLKKIEKKFDEVIESATTETVKQDGSIDCGCGSNVIPRNVNRHKRTKKHVDWALAHGQL